MEQTNSTDHDSQKDNSLEPVYQLSFLCCQNCEEKIDIRQIEQCANCEQQYEKKIRIAIRFARHANAFPEQRFEIENKILHVLED